MMRFTTLALASCLALAACDDNKPRTACSSDEDCRGARVCSEGACTEPGEPDPDAEGDTQPDTADAETDPGVRDIPNERDVPSPEDVTPDLPVEDAPDVPPKTTCELAYDHVVECGYPPPDNLGYDLDWAQCDSFSECGAECVLDMTCGGLDCDFNPDVDCDSAPLYDCLQDRCRDTPDVECRTDAQCNQVYDCCEERWICFGEDGGVTCDLDCQEPPNAPGCECEDGHCRVAAPDPDDLPSICEQAAARFTGECGYDPDQLGPEFATEADLIRRMQDGVCGELEACAAACIVHEEGDTCLSCHFGQQICLRDPFADCWAVCQRNAPAGLCIQSGGLWGDGDCENCCGPAGCGEDPFAGCPEACCGPPQCYCPNDAPFWAADQGCFQAEACFPEGGRACTSLGGVCAQGDCPPDRRDADGTFGCETQRCCLPVD